MLRINDEGTDILCVHRIFVGFMDIRCGYLYTVWSRLFCLFTIIMCSRIYGMFVYIR